MSKASEEAMETKSPTTEEIEVSENQPLRILSHDTSGEDVKEFANTYSLAHRFCILQKASCLLHDDVDEEQIPGITLTELQALSRETTHKWHQPRTLYFAILVCSLGAIEQGWAQTGMNGANLYIPAALGIDSNTTHDSFLLGLINSGLYLSNALCGSWLSEPVNNRIGRRGAIFFASALCLIGNLGSSIISSWPLILFFRLVLGTGLGLNASTVAVYAAECAPAYIRGGLAVSWQMFTAFGILIGVSRQRRFLRPQSRRNMAISARCATIAYGTTSSHGILLSRIAGLADQTLPLRSRLGVFEEAT